METRIYNFLMSILDFEADGDLERNNDFAITTYHSTYFHAVNRKYPVHLNGRRVLIIRFNRLCRSIYRNMPFSVQEMRGIMLVSKFYLGKKLDCKFYTLMYGKKIIFNPYTGHVFDLDLIESELNICLSKPLEGKPKYRISNAQKLNLN